MLATPRAQTGCVDNRNAPFRMARVRGRPQADYKGRTSSWRRTLLRTEPTRSERPRLAAEHPSQQLTGRSPLPAASVGRMQSAMMASGDFGKEEKPEVSAISSARGVLSVSRCVWRRLPPPRNARSCVSKIGHGVLRDEPVFSALFLRYLLTRNIRIEEDFVDRLFNSSESALGAASLAIGQCWKIRGARAGFSQGQPGEPRRDGRHDSLARQLFLRTNSACWGSSPTAAAVSGSAALCSTSSSRTDPQIAPGYSAPRAAG